MRDCKRSGRGVGRCRGLNWSVARGGRAIKTSGGVTVSQSRTEIEVKNKASDEVRYLSGLKSTSFELTVQAGTDPEDISSTDGYKLLLDMFENQTVKAVVFTNPDSGFGKTANMICTKFDASEPLDDLATASVTLKITAQGATE